MLKKIGKHEGKLSNLSVDLLHTRCDACFIPYRQAKMDFYKLGVGCYCLKCLKKLNKELNKICVL